MVAGKVGGHLQRLSHLEREEDEVGVEVWRQLLAPRNVLFAKRDGRLALARIQWELRPRQVGAVQEAHL